MTVMPRRRPRPVLVMLAAAICALAWSGPLQSQAPPAGAAPQGAPPQAGRPQDPSPGRQRPAPPRPTRKQLLVWAEMTGGGAYHESSNAAMAAIYRLGRETGLFDVFLRTDSQFITKKRLTVNADGRDWPVGKNLDSFDGIFFFGMRELPLTQEQMTDLIAFVKDDGKGFAATHTAINAFIRFPEFAAMVGAGYDGHPWGQADATVIVEDPAFPGMDAWPVSFPFRDEWYQVKDFSREQSRVLMTVDASKLDLTNPNVHRTDGDFPQAWARTYGKGRVFMSAMGHASSTWERPEFQKMWLEAIKWSLGLIEADVTPRPKPAGK